MRKRVPRLVISFDSNTQVMAMEAACGADLGRVIPLPTQFSASCGLAWCADPSKQEKLKALMAEHNIVPKEIRIIELFF